jgi:hypothetical protein
MRRCIECVNGEPHSLATNFCLGLDCEVRPEDAEVCPLWDPKHIAEREPAPPQHPGKDE